MRDNVVIWRLVAGPNVMDRLGGILDQVVAISLGWVNWTVWIVRIDWFARRYRRWIVRRDRLRLVLQVNHKVVASLSISLRTIGKVIGNQFVALVFISFDLICRRVIDLGTNLTAWQIITIKFYTSSVIDVLDRTRYLVVAVGYRNRCVALIWRNDQ